MNNILKKEHKRNLIFHIRYDEDYDKNIVIVINKWYWLGTKNLREMSENIVSFISNTINAEKQIKPCVYLTSMSIKEINEKLSKEGLKIEETLSSIRLDD